MYKLVLQDKDTLEWSSLNFHLSGLCIYADGIAWFETKTCQASSELGDSTIRLLVIHPNIITQAELLENFSITLFLILFSQHLSKK